MTMSGTKVSGGARMTIDHHNGFRRELSVVSSARTGKEISAITVTVSSNLLYYPSHEFTAL